jgi:hypothetical protein
MRAYRGIRIWNYIIGFPEDGRAPAETCRKWNCKQIEESLIESCRIQTRWLLIIVHCGCWLLCTCTLWLLIIVHLYTVYCWLLYTCTRCIVDYCALVHGVLLIIVHGVLLIIVHLYTVYCWLLYTCTRCTVDYCALLHVVLLIIVHL